MVILLFFVQMSDNFIIFCKKNKKYLHISNIFCNFVA